jgi:predicted chitinase
MLIVWLVVSEIHLIFQIVNFFLASMHNSDPGWNCLQEFGLSAYTMQQTFSPTFPSKAMHRESVVFISG